MATSMQPELPWNVAGIAPEARDAARTSARREGLSVGEWLTRRILRGLPQSEAAANEWWFAENDPSRAPSNENPSRNGSKRDDDRLQDILRRTNDVRHSETKTAPRNALAPIENPAGRDSETAEQLNDRIVRLDARIARVEIRAAAEEAKNAEAVKALQTRIAELTGQISKTAAHSAAQDAQLAKAIEAVGEKLLRSSSETDERRNAMQARIDTIAEDMASIGETLTESREDGERQLRGVEDRVVVMGTAVEAVRHQGDEVERLGGSLDQLTRRVVTNEEEYLNNVERFEGRLARIEANTGDANIDRRLQSIEQALADMSRLIEENTPGKPVTADALDQPMDLRPDVALPSDAPPPIGAVAAVPILDFPPFPEKPKSDFAPTPQSAASSAPDLRARTQSAPLLDNPPKRPIPAEVESFLAAARRNARGGNSQPRSTFSWIDSAGQKKAEETHTRLILLGALGLVALAAVGTGLYLSNSARIPAAAPPVTARPEHHAVIATRKKPALTTTRPRFARSTSSASIPPGKITVTPTKARPVQTPARLGNVTTAVPVRVAAALTPQQRLAALAASGNAAAQEVLGLEYLDGDGVAVNEAEGAKWLERAATNGEAVAAYRLGTLYERGHGVATNAAKAAQWYAIAAKTGNCKAMHNLAVAYAQGSGVHKDMSLAAQWFSRAASLGLADSQFNLAVLYERGLGVPQSLGQAYKWYSIAAAQGDAESRTRMDAIASQLSAVDKAAAEKSAIHFQPAPTDRSANAPPVAASLVGGT